MKYHDDLMNKAHDALRLHEAKASGLSADDVKNLLSELHTRLMDMEIENDAILKAQKELEQSYNRYAHLFDLSPVGMITLDAGATIMEANLTFANIVGIERRKLIRRDIISLIYAQDHKIFKTFFDILRRSANTAVCEIRIAKENFLYQLNVSGVRFSTSTETNENYILTVYVIRNKSLI